ncbi:MAG: M36 family metallopeptidase, partial [Aequorivita sp.]
MRKSTLLLMVAFLLCFHLSAQHQNLPRQKESERVASQPASISLSTLIQQKSGTYHITAENVSKPSGIRNVYLRQAINGIEVSGTESSIHFDRAGKVLIEHNRFLADVNATVISNSQGISSRQAITSVASQMGYRISDLQEIKKIGGKSKSAVFNKAGISSEDIPVRLIYYYREGIGTQLVWELSIAEKNSSDWWNFRVDAASGRIIDKDNWTVSCNILGDHNDHVHAVESKSAPFVGPMEEPVQYNGASVETGLAAPPIARYNVLAMPIETPNHGSRTMVTNPENLVASPFGWHDTNGVEGAEYTSTRGNNTDTYADDDGNNQPDNKYAYSPGGNLIFNFPFNPVYSSGEKSQLAAITNLFYWNNIIHDVVYQYGFDEASGNFQHNNYGKGGIGNDPVNAEAQDGSGTCNANFSTSPDGIRPRMQMYVCNSRDGDFDNFVIVHEYGHGVSIRLTGGPSVVNCLNNQEQMGEGWSDFYGLMLTTKAGDAGANSRGVGTWLIGEGANGPGIRVYPYSTNFAINPQTYDAIKTAVAPHGVGAVWATMLWEMTWEIMATVPFDPDIYNGSGGNNIALALVTEGLKLQPCSPGFVDGRNAILAADQALYGGAYKCQIWNAFARRGLGYSASQGSTNNKNDGVQAFDLPPIFVNLNVVEEVCLSDGVQTGLSGGYPAGGVYSGPGVTDDGNGTTFAFDPSVGGPGLVTVSYTVNDPCTGSPTTTTDTINVTNEPPTIVCLGSGTVTMTGTQSASPNVPIPDNNATGVTRTMTVTENVAITDLNVNLDISHTWVGDVIVRIKSPAGTTAVIVDRPGRTSSGFGCDGDDIFATLDDEAATNVENECAPTVPTINGRFRPNNPLSVFDGQNTQGVWEITVYDRDSGYTGTLNSWGIEYEYEITTTPLDVTLDATGNATINAEDLLFSVDVECGTYTVLAGNPLASTVSFTCADIGLKTVAVQVTNAGGAASTCIATVNIIDGSEGGSLECPLDIMQPTDPGVCGAVVTYVVETPVACGGGGTLTQTAGLASGSTFPVGTTTNTFEYDDGINPVQTCSFDITINDNELPVAVCKNITIQLDANGNTSIATSDINNGSSDNCGIVSMSLSKTNFTCADVGDNNVSLTVKDANGNTDTCIAVVTVEDNFAPTAICQNITVQLDSNGNASITAADVDGGSSDTCGIDSLSVSPSTFTCADVGANNVTLTVTDINGNVSTCVAVVTVEDNTAPTAVCQNITVQLDANGNASITAADVDGGSSDACGIDSLSVSPSTFTCADVGANNVTLTVTDINGNVSTCVAVVTVEDNIAPTAVCQDITVQLDSNGNVSITAADVDGGSSDACGIDTLSVSPNTFTCADVGANNVTLTVTDINGNVSTCVAVVTVEDNIAPTAVCQDITVQLDSTGNATITAADVDGGSADACGIDSLSVSPSTFTCADLGVNNVTLTVTDINGNISTCVAVVTVIDSGGGGSLTCPGDIIQDNDLGICGALVTYSISTPTGCSGGGILTQTSGLPSGSTFPVGTTTNTFEYDDGINP